MISYMGRATSNQNTFVSCIHPHTHTHTALGISIYGKVQWCVIGTQQARTVWGGEIWIQVRTCILSQCTKRIPCTFRGKGKA